MADNLRGAEALYRVLEILKSELNSSPFCNSVTVGTLTEIDLAKMTIFPMAHLTLDNVTHNDNSLSFQITMFNLDIVDVSKEPTTDAVYGNDNLIYIWTNQLFVLNRLISRLKSNFTNYEGWELDGNPQSEFIDKQFENMLAGYQTTINLTVPNDISKC
jgi:hypothetical protein